jgi:hypothetical protein
MDFLSLGGKEKRKSINSDGLNLARLSPIQAERARAGRFALGTLVV